MAKPKESLIDNTGQDKKVSEVKATSKLGLTGSTKKITHLRLIAQINNRETPDGKRLNKGESQTVTIEQCKGLVEQLPDGSYKLIPSLHGRGIWGLENVEAV